MPPKKSTGGEEMKAGDKAAGKAEKTPRKKSEAADTGASPGASSTKTKEKPGADAAGPAKDKKKSKKSDAAIVVADKGGGGLVDDVKIGGKVDAAAAKKKKSAQQEAQDKRKAAKTVLQAAKKRGKKKGPIMRMMESMGIGLHDIQIRDQQALEIVGRLELQQKHLHRLMRRFEDIDLDGSGTMDTTEYLESVGEQRSPFTDRMFSLLDIDPNGVLDFDDFVRVTANYCMFTKVRMRLRVRPIRTGDGSTCANVSRR